VNLHGILPDDFSHALLKSGCTIKVFSMALQERLDPWL
jgi:hypothetical protein